MPFVLIALCSFFQGQLTYWSAIFLCFGSAIFFGFKTNPDPFILYILIFLSLIGLIFVWSCEHHFKKTKNVTFLFVLRNILICFSAAILGLGFASIRTHMVAAPVLKSPIYNASVIAQLERVEPFKDKVRLYVEPLSISKLVSGRELNVDKNSYPRRLRVNLKGDASHLNSGDIIEFRSFLIPPPEPVLPESYDFGRSAWFERLGAVGRIHGTVHVLKRAPDTIFDKISAVRRQIVERLKSGLSSEVSGIAIAILTGHRGQIDTETRQKIINSGLAHLLAISGLHIGLVAAFSFICLRTLGAMSFQITERFPLKKIAALLSIPLALGYVLISGQPPSAVRAMIMVCVAMIAISCDRQPLTLRSIAFAAILIVVFLPEVVITPGFQMSFAAVTALVAFYERNQLTNFKNIGSKRSKFKVINKLFSYCFVIALTSCIATVATLPFSLFHFNKFVTYGVFSNLIGVPWFTFLIMGPGLISLILMPFGLEALPLGVMEFGIRVFIGLAGDFSDLPHSIFLGQAPSAFLCSISALGGLWFLIVLKWPRWIGLVLLILPLIAAQFAPLPKLFIGLRGLAVGVLTEDLKIVTPLNDRQSYVRSVWAQSLGLNENSLETLQIGQRINIDSRGGYFECHEDFCTVFTEGRYLIYVQKPKKNSIKNFDTYFKENKGLLYNYICRDTTLVLSVREKFPNCHADQTPKTLWLKEIGSAAIFLDHKGNFEIKSVADWRGNRPWVHSKN